MQVPSLSEDPPLLWDQHLIEQTLEGSVRHPNGDVLSARKIALYVQDIFNYKLLGEGKINSAGKFSITFQVRNLQYNNENPVILKIFDETVPGQHEQEREACQFTIKIPNHSGTFYVPALVFDISEQQNEIVARELPKEDPISDLTAIS